MELDVKPGLSIFSRLLIVFLSVNVVTGAALIFFGYSFSSRSMENRARVTIDQQFLGISRRFEQEFRIDLKRTISRLISSTLLDDHLFASKAEQVITAKRMEQLFVQTTREFSGFERISFVNLDGVSEVDVVVKKTRSGSAVGQGTPTSAAVPPVGSAGSRAPGRTRSRKRYRSPYATAPTT